MKWRQRHAPAGLGLAAAAFPCAAASAQEPAGGGLSLETSPFAPPKPGQTQGIVSPATPRGLSLGTLHWAPIASRCTFVAGEGAPAEMNAEVTDGVNGVRRPYVFVTMAATGTEGAPALERGYVMANGLVRELEKGKTAADKDGSVVTVWRAAAEPRINVNLVLSEAQEAGKTVEYSGAMTVFWGDKKEEVPIRGQCR